MKEFEQFLRETRGIGNTSAAIRACKATGATLILSKQVVADKVAKEHEISTATIHSWKPSMGAHILDSSVLCSAVFDNSRE